MEFYNARRDYIRGWRDIYDFFIDFDWHRDYCYYDIYVNGDFLVTVYPTRKKKKTEFKSTYHQKNMKQIKKITDTYLDMNGFQKRKK